MLFFSGSSTVEQFIVVLVVMVMHNSVVMVLVLAMVMVFPVNAAILHFLVQMKIIICNFEFVL